MPKQVINWSKIKKLWAGVKKISDLPPHGLKNPFNLIFRTSTTPTMNRHHQKSTTQCHICLVDGTKPSSNLTKSIKEKFNIRDWMMVCTDCAKIIIINDTIKTIAANFPNNNINDEPPFGPGPSIDEHSIFF